MKISLSDDKKQLNKYIKEERVGNIQPDAIDNSMVETIEANHTEVKSNITKLEPEVDKLYFTAFQLNRASDLLKSVEQQQLNKRCHSICRVTQINQKWKHINPYRPAAVAITDGLYR